MFLFAYRFYCIICHDVLSAAYVCVVSGDSCSGTGSILTVVSAVPAFHGEGSNGSGADTGAVYAEASLCDAGGYGADRHSHFLRIGKLRRCGILFASDSDHQCTYDQFHGCGRGYGEAASADRRHFGKQGYAGNHRGIYHYGGRSISHSQNECGSFLDHRNDRRSHDRSTDPAGGGSYV